MSHTARRIRIVLAEMPPVLSEIVVEAIQEQPDMEIVGEPRDGRGLLRAMAGADVVILSERQGTGVPAGPPPDDATPTRVLMVAIVEDRTLMYELGPRRATLRDVSPHRLVEAIRGWYLDTHASRDAR